MQLAGPLTLPGIEDPHGSALQVISLTSCAWIPGTDAHDTVQGHKNNYH